jgi:hypothetical protein
MKPEDIESLINLLLLNIKHCTKQQIDRLSFATWMEAVERGEENVSD